MPTSSAVRGTTKIVRGCLFTTRIALRHEPSSRLLSTDVEKPDIVNVALITMSIMMMPTMTTVIPALAASNNGVEIHIVCIF